MNPNFPARHIGPNGADVAKMLDSLSLGSVDELLKQVVPSDILDTGKLTVPDALNEHEALDALQQLAAQNKVVRTLLGQGYHDCHTPSVIRRCVLESPGWYTAYTPYQPEITAEAVALAHRAARGKKNTVLVDEGCHSQTLAVLRTRAEPLDINIQLVSVADIPKHLDKDAGDVCAVVSQYTHTAGQVQPIQPAIEAANAVKALAIVIADPLALMVLPAPGEYGADIVVGSAQRFGVPMGFGGPHAAFMACTDACKRNIPGRLVGQSITTNGEPAYRLALQTREQHIRRDKATSNICTAQALLAIVATLYACYHGPKGLQDMARRTRAQADRLAASLAAAGGTVNNDDWFDTVHIGVPAGSLNDVVAALLDANFNVKRFSDDSITLSVDETITDTDVEVIVAAFVKGLGKAAAATAEKALGAKSRLRDNANDRALNFLTQACFNSFHSETEMMRYCRRLADKDLALDRAMIPLGSCTMKLNAASEMMPILWPEFSRMHPFAPDDQTVGYRAMITDVENWLCACTGYDAVSLQPNAGSQGEYAGLLAIRAYHDSRGDSHRNVCLIPASAHGTNPASAQMVGMDVVVVACDDNGNVDLADLDAYTKPFVFRTVVVDQGLGLWLLENI